MARVSRPTSGTWSPSATSPRTRCGPTSATSPGMLEHAARAGAHRPGTTLDLRTLRSWLAKQQTLGKARTTMARRATAVRVFTAWAQRTGRIADRPGRAASARPRRTSTLPPALRADEAAGLLRGRRGRAPTTAARSGCATSRSSSCSTPPASGSASCAASTSTTSTASGGWSGCSARAARSAPCRTASRPSGRSTPGCEPGGPQLARAGRGRGAVPRRPRRADRPAGGPHPRARPARRRARRARHGAARPAAHRRHPPARGRRRPAHRPGAARPRVAGDHADLHPRHHRPAPAGLPSGAPAPEPCQPSAVAGGGPRGRRAAPDEPARRVPGRARRPPQREQPDRARPRPGSAGRGRSRPASRPQCRQARGKQCDPSSCERADARRRAATSSPTAHARARPARRWCGSPPWSTTTTPRPASRPANVTRPASAARTGCPTCPAGPRRGAPPPSGCPAGRSRARPRARVERPHAVGGRGPGSA